MEKLIKNKGITLVALVITIIILLILAGVSIQAITNTGLFKNAKKAQENYSIKEAEEKLTIKLMQLQTNTISELGRNAKLEDIDELINKNSKFYDKDIEDVKDKKQNKAVKIAGYYFEIDNNLNIIGKIDASEVVRTDVGYKINTINENTINVTVKIRNEEGIKKIIKPDNSEMILNDQKEQIEIEYNVEEGKEYKFKVLLSESDTIKEYVLRPSLDIGPEIIQSNGSEYPILTVYGVKTNKKVTINYGENKDNYYSLDNGITWKEYTEDGISVKQECTILAKSVVDGEITKEIQGNITMQLASNALGSNAYDNDMSTVETLKNYQKIIYIDEIAWNRKIKIYAKWGDSRLNYYIYDKNGNILSSLTTDENRITATSTLEIKIPENAYKIGLYWQHASNYGYVNIQNIKFDNSPTIKNRYVYPVITKDGIKKEELYATIEYLESSVIKKYKINDGEWQDYKSEFQYNVGDKLYTKGIDQNGEETFESETKYEVGGNVDGIGKNAYDGDTNTYITLSNKQRNLYIDENANIKSINVNMQLGDARLNYYIYDKEGNVLDSDTSDYTRFSTTQNKKINIPDNAYRISFYWMNAGKYGYIKVKEITVEYK